MGRKIGYASILFCRIESNNENSASEQWSTENWDIYRGYLSTEINEIFHGVRNIILLDPIDRFSPYFTHGPPRSNKDLRQLPLIRRGQSQNIRQDILNSAGLKQREIDSGKVLQLEGILSDINARTIHNGAFRLALTDDPSRHLLFDESGARNHPTILVLDSRTVSILALLDLTGFME